MEPEADVEMEQAVTDEQIEFFLNDIANTHEKHPFRKVFEYKEHQFLGQIPLDEVTDFLDSLEALQNCRYIQNRGEKSEKADNYGSSSGRESFEYKGVQLGKVRRPVGG
jgi:hypothetical protein